MTVLKRAISVDEMYKMKFKLLDFDGDWAALIGLPELTGCWTIYGDSGNGKTTFNLQLAKYLTRFGKVAYNTIEEGAKATFQRAFIQVGMKACKGKLIVLDKESYQELRTRLSKPKSPSIIIIDSVQYFDADKRMIKALVREFPNKLFIFISHVEGNKPQGSTAKAVLYDSDVKIRVEGFKAFPISRYGGTTPYVIWQEGADDYWMNIA